MAVTTNTRKLAALLGASGEGIGTDGLMQPAGIDADMASQAELDAIETEADKTQTNLAILAFKSAANGSLAKYNLQDQIVDEFVNATGVDAGASSNATLTSGVYAAGAASATGGTITEYTGGGVTYKVHTFLLAQSGNNFVPPSSLDVDYLIVAGGGGGGRYLGGGGAGGYRTSASTVTLSAQNYAVVVGAGGDGAATTSVYGGTGGNSSFNSITSAGGGGGSSQGSTIGGQYVGQPGGSGGGHGNNANGAGGASSPVTSPVQGYKGGDTSSSSHTSGAGGGGAGGEGVDAGYTAGYGGVGRDTLMGLSAANSTLVLASAGVGVVDGGTRWLAGGGAGAFWPSWPSASGAWALGIGGKGGGGNGAGVASFPSGPALDGIDGVDNTGSGGGGGSQSGTYNSIVYSYVTGDGGNGVVVIRYPLSYTDLTLQSTDTEAESIPTKADMVMLVEDAGTGVGTINTHIKGWISRDSGTTFTQGTLVDEGDWGTDKRILAFHDLDISGQPSDQTMCYKITTHSSSAVYDTKVHATSIGWR